MHWFLNFFHLCIILTDSETATTGVCNVPGTSCRKQLSFNDLMLRPSNLWKYELTIEMKGKIIRRLWEYKTKSTFIDTTQELGFDIWISGQNL